MSLSAGPELVVCPREGRIPSATCASGHVGTGGGGGRRVETAQAQTRGSEATPLGAQPGGPGARGDGGRLARGALSSFPTKRASRSRGTRVTLARAAWLGACSLQGAGAEATPQVPGREATALRGAPVAVKDTVTGARKLCVSAGPAPGSVLGGRTDARGPLPRQSGEAPPPDHDTPGLGSSEPWPWFAQPSFSKSPHSSHPAYGPSVTVPLPGPCPLPPSPQLPCFAPAHLSSVLVSPSTPAAERISLHADKCP